MTRIDLHVDSRESLSSDWSTSASSSRPSPPDLASGIVGVLGGLGPLASAEFLKTVYSFPTVHPEQRRPRVVMLSDPTVPDRTSALLSGQSDVLRAALERGLRLLEGCGANHFIICCVTLHVVLRELVDDLQRRVCSLVDLSLEEVRRRSGAYVLVCSTGTRQLEVFQKHPSWRGVSARIKLPAEADQETLHSLIYELKAGRDIADVSAGIERIVRGYGSCGYIAGCTELHLVNKQFGPLGHPDCIDPLMLAARLMQVSS